jgi:hypothetical protein
MNSHDLDDIDDTPLVATTAVAFKKKIIKKKPQLSRRKLSFGDDDDDITVPDAKPATSKFKVPVIKKKPIARKEVSPFVDLPADLENGPVIENIHNIDLSNAQVITTPEQSTSGSGSLRRFDSSITTKKYVPVSSETEFVPPSLKDIENEYGGYDPEDIAQEKPNKPSLDADDMDVDVENDGDLVIDDAPSRPNEDLYDLEIGQVSSENEEDSKYRKMDGTTILSVPEQLDHLRQAREIIKQQQEKQEQEKVMLESQLQTIRDKRTMYLHELQS